MGDKLEKALPGVFVELGGKKRQLEASMYALARIKAVTGKNPLLAKPSQRDADGEPLPPEEQPEDPNRLSTVDPDEIAGVIWALCIEHDPELDVPVEEAGKTIEQVQRWLKFTDGSWIRALTAMNKCFEAGAPEPAKND